MYVLPRESLEIFTTFLAIFFSYYVVPLVWLLSVIVAFCQVALYVFTASITSANMKDFWEQAIMHVVHKAFFAMICHRRNEIRQGCIDFFVRELLAQLQPTTGVTTEVGHVRYSWHHWRCPRKGEFKPKRDFWEFEGLFENRFWTRLPATYV